MILSSVRMYNTLYFAKRRKKETKTNSAIRLIKQILLTGNYFIFDLLSKTHFSWKFIAAYHALIKSSAKWKASWQVTLVNQFTQFIDKKKKKKKGSKWMQYPLSFMTDELYISLYQWMTILFVNPVSWAIGYADKHLYWGVRPRSNEWHGYDIKLHLMVRL